MVCEGWEALEGARYPIPLFLPSFPVMYTLAITYSKNCIEAILVFPLGYCHCLFYVS